MSSEEFYKRFTTYVKTNRNKEANMVLMSELGNIMIHKREDFIYMLKYSGLDVPENVSDINLINLFIDNIDRNKRLLLGTAFLLSHSYKMTGFDGVDYTSNICADAMHKSMSSFYGIDKRDKIMGFDGDMNNIYADGEGMSNFEGDPDNLAYSNGDGDVDGNNGGFDWGNLAKQSIPSAINATSQALNNVGKKRDVQAAQSSNAAVDIIKQKAAAKDSLLQSVIDIKKQQADAAGKTDKTKLIVVGSIVGVVIIAALVVAIKMKNR